MANKDKESLNVRILKGLLLVEGVSVDEINATLQDCKSDQSKNSKLKKMLESRELEYPSPSKSRKFSYPSLDSLFGKTIADQLTKWFELNNLDNPTINIDNKVVSTLSIDDIELLIKRREYLTAKSNLDSITQKLSSLGVSLDFDKIISSINTENQKKNK